MTVRMRFLWLRTDTDTPRWELAHSADGGVTWETNWTMDFERAWGESAGEQCLVAGDAGG